MRTVLPPLRVVLLLACVALLLALVTVFAPIGHAQGDVFRPLSPNQALLVSQKAEALGSTSSLTDVTAADASVSSESAPGLADQTQTFAGPESTSRAFNTTVPITKAELLDAQQADIDSAQARLDFLTSRSVGLGSDLRLDSFSDSAVAPDVIQELQQELSVLQDRLEELRSLPDTYVQQVPIQGVETGSHSITYTNMTYSGNTPKDPINVFFYRVGSAPDVYYDMRYWTRYKWNPTSCGIEPFSRQRVYIWDSMHRGGWNGWKDQYSGQLDRYGTYCGSSRYHLRLFQGHVPDSDYGGFGTWSMTAAHWDNWGHLSAGYWESAESHVKYSFRQQDGRPLWFVGRIWSTSINNRGTYQGHRNDGYATFIELLR